MCVCVSVGVCRWGLWGVRGHDGWTKRLSDATTKTHHQYEKRGTEVKGKGVYNTAQAWQLVKTSFFVFGTVSPHHPPFAKGHRQDSQGAESVLSPPASFCGGFKTNINSK